jgi:lysophospholipase L1-like esterase
MAGVKTTTTTEKYVYMFIFFFGIIAFIISVKRGFKLDELIETFDSKSEFKHSIVLIGDSILKNNMYVGKGKAVDDLLEEKFTGNVYNLAEDNSKIVDVYTQMQLIPKELDHQSTYIFVSVGGNDILERYVYENTNTDNTMPLYKMFIHYKTLIHHLRNKMPKAKIVLVNIYYPKSPKYQSYLDTIKKWNELLDEFSADPIHKISDILMLSTIMTNKADFSLAIEPSEDGSIKIVKGILDIVNA